MLQRTRNTYVFLCWLMLVLMPIFGCGDKGSATSPSTPFGTGFSSQGDSPSAPTSPPTTSNPEAAPPAPTTGREACGLAVKPAGSSLTMDKQGYIKGHIAVDYDGPGTVWIYLWDPDVNAGTKYGAFPANAPFEFQPGEVKPYRFRIAAEVDLNGDRRADNYCQDDRFFIEAEPPVDPPDEPICNPRKLREEAEAEAEQKCPYGVASIEYDTRPNVCSYDISCRTCEEVNPPTVLSLELIAPTKETYNCKRVGLCGHSGSLCRLTEDNHCKGKLTGHDYGPANVEIERQNDLVCKAKVKNAGHWVVSIGTETRPYETNPKKHNSLGLECDSGIRSFQTSYAWKNHGDDEWTCALFLDGVEQGTQTVVHDN